MSSPFRAPGSAMNVHAGLIALLGNDPDLLREGLLGIATQCHHGDD